MNRNDLYKSFNEIDDDILERSEFSVGRKKKTVLLKWSAIAACLCLVIISSVSLYMLNQKPGSYIPSPSDNYPYNDNKVLNYIGMQLDTIQTGLGTIFFNEITDIEAYRKFNTAYGFENAPYYSTRKTAYDLLTWYPIENENDFHNVTIFEKDGSLENCPSYDEFLMLTAKTPLAEKLIMQIFEGGHATHISAYYNVSLEALGISFNPTSNCIATVVVAKDLSVIDNRFTDILPIFQETLGTENSSYIGEQEISVHYFYQNRLFRNSTTEEAYQYYVYFERDGLQYLYQFSSNWSLPGQNVSALHNPPSTLHYVATQDKCQTLFKEYLLTLINIM